MLENLIYKKYIRSKKKFVKNNMATMISNALISTKQVIPIDSFPQNAKELAEAKDKSQVKYSKKVSKGAVII